MYVCMSVCYVRLSGCLSVRMNAEISETGMNVEISETISRLLRF